MNNNLRPQLNELKEFSFAKTPVLAGIMTTGEAIALKPVVENLGLDWSSQLKRLKRDQSKNQSWSSYKIESRDGKSYEMICMDPVNFQEWLWDINVSGNLDGFLLQQYKKGLVVHLMLMLKISLDEVQRLRSVERKFEELKRNTGMMMGMESRRQENRKENMELTHAKNMIAKSIQESLFEDPNQLRIED